MAKKSIPLPYSFICSSVSKDEKYGCLLEVSCATEEGTVNESIRQFAKGMCQQVLTQKALYLNRKTVPWEAIREQERKLRAEAETKFSNSEKVDDYLRKSLSKWYAKVCLMEQLLAGETKRTVGLELTSVRKSCGIKFDVTKLVILKASADNELKA